MWDCIHTLYIRIKNGIKTNALARKENFVFLSHMSHTDENPLSANGFGVGHGVPHCPTCPTDMIL